jgi:Tol biopolymer transport system component
LGASSLLLLLLALPAALAAVVKIERITPPPLDVEVPLPSESPVLSGDGRLAAFVIPGQGVYLRDRATGATELVTVTAGGEAAAGESSSPAISRDGRFVAFVSQARNLVVGDTTAGNNGIYVRDRQNGVTERVSVSSLGTPAGGELYAPAISDDGRFVAFTANSNNLAPGDRPNTPDVYLRDRLNRTTVFVAVGSPARPQVAISGNGRYLGFASPTGDPESGEYDRETDLLFWDRLTRQTERIGDGDTPAISQDGRVVAFRSGNPDYRTLILVRDRGRGTTELASVSTRGAPADQGCYAPAISRDGRFVVFNSHAGNLVPPGTASGSGPYVRDRQNGTTEPVIAPGGEPTSVLIDRAASVSDDGKVVAFTQYAGNAPRAVVTDRAAKTSERITLPGSVRNAPLESGEPSISEDGQWVTFVTGGQVFVRTRETGMAMLVSATPGGTPGNRPSLTPAISGDGSFVAFYSYADDLVAEDTNGTVDLFGWDRQSGRIERLNVESSGAPISLGELSLPAVSRDGQWVAFPGGENIQLRDRKSGTTQVVSVSVEGEPVYGAYPSISDDGRLIAFWSWADNLVDGDTNGRRDVFVRDRVLAKTEIVSVAADGGPALGYWEGSSSPAISGNGQFVAFLSVAVNMAPGGTNSWGPAVYVRELAAKKTERVSVSTSGEPAGGYSYSPVISDDGRFVAFLSDDGNLAPEGNSGLFVRDRTSRITEFVAPGDPWSDRVAINRDGRVVAFSSTDGALVSGDTNGKRDVFVVERE